jgi:CubicO group peptidase (beta-lactamase class C family)
VLFEPLGIDAFEWMAGKDGVASPASGLRLTPRHLARIGQMMLAGGRWEDREVVPTEWLEASFRHRVTIAQGVGYGYQWYLGTFPPVSANAAPVPWVGGMGNGGQRLIIARDLDLVVAIAAGNYNTADQSATPSAVLRAIRAGIERLPGR